MREQLSMPPETPLLAESLNARFSRLNRQLRNVDLPKGMTPERMSALATLAASGSISVSGLADSEQVRPATMSRMVSALVDERLVRRDENSNDGRGVLLSLTPHGRRELARAQRFRLDRLATALGMLPPEQLAVMHELVDALGKLSEALNHPE